ncbi:perlucin-like protein [Ruditapes philippinarum]|uniref:perlucin-like protein n=1 Tax=Ruditapes philippinarum TaxID=129788 RepID=UPI00295B64AA|nr:perlucin-like protein [Ruditapes philippinarum]
MRWLLEVALAFCCIYCIAVAEITGVSDEQKILIKLDQLLEIVKGGTGGETCKARCQDGWLQYQGSCYLIVHNQFTFYEAEANCKKHGADLVSIENANENTFLKKQLTTLKGTDFWIGLTDSVTEGVFKWVADQSNAVFTDWEKGQPDNYLGNEDCVHVHASRNFVWNDKPCSDRILSICEETFRFKQY